METKKLKKLNIAVSYSVEMKDVEIPEEICNNLVGLYEMDITELKPNSNYDIENGVCSWLSKIVGERAFEIEIRDRRLGRVKNQVVAKSTTTQTNKRVTI